jgi:hypothetical protein
MNLSIPDYFTGEGKYIKPKCGIYAVVNPLGEIYIGQSENIPQRVRGLRGWTWR